MKLHKLKPLGPFRKAAPVLNDRGTGRKMKAMNRMKILAHHSFRRYLMNQRKLGNHTTCNQCRKKRYLLESYKKPVHTSRDDIRRGDAVSVVLDRKGIE